MSQGPNPKDLTDWVKLALEVIEALRDAWPVRWSNVRVEREIDELKLGFVCDDAALGTMRVVLTDPDQNPVALMEAPNGEYRKPEVFGNLLDLGEPLLYELFQAGRCLREHARKGDGNFWRGFEYHLKNAIRIGREGSPENAAGSGA